MRATQTRGRAPPGWSGISSACSKISPTIFRCCGRWSIAAPEGRSDCRCRAGAMNASRRHCSRICPSAMNPLAKEAFVARGRPPANTTRGVVLADAGVAAPIREQEQPPAGDQSPPENEPLGAKDGQPQASHRRGGGDPRHGGRTAASGAVRSAGAVRVAAGRYRSWRRLVDSTIWINDAHPAYTRALASRSLGYHTALAVALALAPLAVEARDEHTFITQFLAHWGSAQARNRVPGRRRAEEDRVKNSFAAPRRSIAGAAWASYLTVMTIGQPGAWPRKHEKIRKHETKKARPLAFEFRDFGIFRGFVIRLLSRRGHNARNDRGVRCDSLHALA